MGLMTTMRARAAGLPARSAPPGSRRSIRAPPDFRDKTMLAAKSAHPVINGAFSTKEEELTRTQKAGLGSPKLSPALSRSTANER